jgi:hypothetical protein
VPLARRQVGGDRGAERGEQLVGLGLLPGAKAEAVGHAVPRLGIEVDAGGAPEMAANLVRDLDDRELRRPGGEEAFAAKAVELCEDRDERVVRRLVGEIVELGAAEREPRAAPGDLAAGDLEEPLVQPANRLEAPRPAQIDQPAGRLEVWSEGRGGDRCKCQGGAIVDTRGSSATDVISS